MSEERLRILELLKEGKISTDEALELLNQIPQEDKQYENTREQQRDDWSDLNGFGRYTFTPDFSWIDDLRSVIKETAQTAASFSGDFLFGTAREETYKAEADVGNGIRALMFEGKNAPVKLESYCGNKIEIEARYKVKNRWDSHLALTEESGVFSLFYDNNALYYLAITVRVPETAQIGSINLKSKNAPVSAQDVSAEKIEINTKNAPVKVSDVKASHLYCDTTNAPISLDDIETRELEAFTTNAKISMDDVNAYRVRLTSTNAKISVNDSCVTQLYTKTVNARISIDNIIIGNDEPLSSIDAVTTNGGVTVKFKANEQNLRLRASTTNGGISLELKDLEYRVKEKNYVEALSRGYDENPVKLNMNLQTTNGSINVKR